MSIFHDPQLLNTFLDLMHPVIKSAQTPPVDPAMVKSLAAKMVDNLSKAISITTDRPDAAVYMRDLQDLNSFISHLKIENVQFAGKMIVVGDYAALPAEDKALYVPYKWQGGVEAFPVNSTVGIYKDGLIAYLKMLQQNATKTGGAQEKLLSMLISKLVDSANATLKLGITHDALKDKTTTDAKSAIKDDAILDSIDETVVVETPLSPARGNLAVTPKDLKTKQSFYYWAQKLKVSKGGKVLSHEDFTNDTFCDLIRVLYDRAYAYSYRRGAPEDHAYLQLMTDLAGMYVCNVGAPAETGAGSAEHAGYRQVSDTKLDAQSQALAKSLAMKMPLLGDRIDFPRIGNWLNGYVQIGKQINMDAATSAAIGHAQQILATIANTYRIPAQSLAQEATSVASSVITNTLGAISQKANAPAGYLSQLQQLMSLLGTILSAFKNNVYDSLPQDAKDDIDEQIGASGSSFYNINIDRVNNWLMDLPSALQSLKGRGF